MSSDAHVNELKDILAGSKPPYCAGTLPLPDESFLLFYRKGGEKSAKCIDLAHSSVTELEDLTSACLPATFGVNQEDVYDEKYRKAGKLDSTDFATKVDLERSGLMDAIRYDLLEGREGTRPIWAELYKLNVYGKDNFFKTHKDTPRSTDMFGSLVLVFPTEHEGGALLLRHSGREWDFDSAKLIADQKAAATDDKRSHVGYVAFFSDVDHEVAKVISGHRVTITYNLHFKDKEPSFEQVSMLPPIEMTFKKALESALGDDTFLPDGGYLGFGFCHEYPVETGPERPHTNKVQLVARYLKGRDAVIRRVCTSLGLLTKIMLDFEEKGQWGGEYEFLHDSELRFNPDSLHLEDDSTLTECMRTYHNNSSVIKHEYEAPDFTVLWVTDRREYNQIELPYLMMGNQPCLSCVYGKFCFLVKVGKSGERKTVE